MSLLRRSLWLSIPLVVAAACAHPAPPAPVPAPVLPAVQVEPPASNLDEARALKSAGRLESYDRSLHFLSLSADPVTARRATALLGLFDFEQKRWDDAYDALTKAIAADPTIAPYLQLRLIEVEQNRNHAANAAAIAAQLIATAPDSAAAAIARVRLPALYAESGDRTATDAAFTQAMATLIDELTETELVSLATRLDSAQRPDLATQIRMRLLTAYPQGRFTEKTWGQLVAAGEPLASLSFDESLAIAQSLVRNDRYDQAFEMLDRIAQRFPEATTTAPYENVRNRALFGSRRYTELIAKNSGRALDASTQLLVARAEWRAGQPDAFLAGLKKIEKQFPSSREAIEAKVLRAKYDVTDVTDYASAIKNLRAVIDAGSLGTEGENLWNLGWTYFLWGREADALATFSDYVRRLPDGDYTSNALFWSGKIFDKSGNRSERDAAFRSLIAKYPYSYFSYRARQIMGDPTLADAQAGVSVPKGSSGSSSQTPGTPSITDTTRGTPRNPEEPRGTVAKFPDIEAQIDSAADPRLDTVRELGALDLSRDASLEMKRVAAAYPENLGLQFMLADVYVRGGEPFKANNILQRKFREFVRHGGTDIPHRFWEILFPLNYWPAISTEAGKRGIDPYLVASIIRQESGFEPTVVSNAGAVGLMQIMPAEAQAIASKAGIESVTREALFNPMINIAVGAAEFSQKLAAMNGNPTLAIAAYNAGEGPVGKWIAHTPVEDIDLFVESIPYSETRLYVKSVTRNRFEYRRIYESSIAAKESQ